jgi:hypothetical protein
MTKPFDGIAVLLHLIEAAREVTAGDTVDHAGQDVTTLRGWVRELERHLETIVPAVPEVSWEPRRWRELVQGDRVSLGGVEAEVESTSTSTWHVDPDSSEYRPQPLEHTITHLRLVGRDTLYRMDPEGEVETFRGPAGQAVDEANGRHLGLVGADRHVVLASWAADAFTTLEAAGLSPEPIAMTPPEEL